MNILIIGGATNKSLPTRVDLIVVYFKFETRKTEKNSSVL